MRGNSGDLGAGDLFADFHPSRPPSCFEDATGPAEQDQVHEGVKSKLGKLLPRAVSNMPGEERWRVLEVEPTRALGHAHSEHVGSRFLAPNRRPEILEWKVKAPERTMLLICSDGLFSKHAFPSVPRVLSFLIDPEAYCKSKDFFEGTCLLTALSNTSRSEPMLPDPSACSMQELFEQIFDVVLPSLNDDTWSDAYTSAFHFLSMFAMEKPTPNIHTQPAKTVAAACYLAVLLLSDDNVSCSVAQLGENPKMKTDGTADHELRLEIGAH